MSIDLNTKLSPHFALYEMIRSETAVRRGIDNTPPAGLIPKLQTLCQEILEPVRAHFARPIRPNSAYRSPAVNKAVGGSGKSQHCKGEAVDIEIAGVSNYDLASWIHDNLIYDQLILECYTSGIPSSGWVHVSWRQGANRNRAMTYSNGVYQPGLLV